MPLYKFPQIFIRNETREVTMMWMKKRLVLFSFQSVQSLLRHSIGQIEENTTRLKSGYSGRWQIFQSLFQNFHTIKITVFWNLTPFTYVLTEVYGHIVLLPLSSGSKIMPRKISREKQGESTLKKETARFSGTPVNICQTTQRSTLADITLHSCICMVLRSYTIIHIYKFTVIKKVGAISS